MSGEIHHLTSLLFYLICFKIILINSKTSTLWKLNADKTRIIEADSFNEIVSGSLQNALNYITEDDPIFNIITSTVHLGESWVKQKIEIYNNCCSLIENKTIIQKNNFETDELLDCGKPVNFTFYDNLVGIINRNKHPNVPEPTAILHFLKKNSKTKDIIDFDVDILERKLKRAKREKPKSVQLYNQIGNFWRIKGDAKKSIECFRRALAVSPHNSEVLLNLARVLFALQYLDDAIFLTRRSMEAQPDKGTWQHYFTLGEIFKVYGHYQEAAKNLKRTLELKPDHEPALLALKEMESMPATTIHVYTLVIIICLVFGVLLVILSSVEVSETDIGEIKTQRHFNKAMAMRSLRGFGMTKIRNKKLLF